MEKKKLTLKELNRLFKESEVYWQDQQDKNVFYFVSKGQLKPMPKMKGLSVFTKK